jgi:hypothetical protein
MDSIGPGPSMPEITEDNLVESRGRVLWQQVQRYEQMWAIVEQRLEWDRDLTAPIDVRMLEVGRGILRDQAGLYRLGRPAPATEQEEDANAAVDRAALVEENLRELESRLRGSQGQEAEPGTAAG